MVIDESSAIIPPNDECRHCRGILVQGLEGLPCPSCSGSIIWILCPVRNDPSPRRDGGDIRIIFMK